VVEQGLERLLVSAQKKTKDWCHYFLPFTKEISIRVGMGKGVLNEK